MISPNFSHQYIHSNPLKFVSPLKLFLSSLIFSILSLHLAIGY